MSMSLKQTWQIALQVKGFRVKCIISILLLAICGIVSPMIFQFIQQREGTILHDAFLNLFPSIDLSLSIFILLYLIILVALVSLIKRPHQLLIAIQAYSFLTVFRFITL